MIWQFVALLAVHWLADFVLQTHWQASNKSKNNVALAYHTLVYTGCINLAALAMFDKVDALMFALVNGVLHFFTDWCTSRVTSRLFMDQFNQFDIVTGVDRQGRAQKENRMLMKNNFNPHNFFVVIGLDQLIHQVTLAGTMVLFFGR